MLISITIFSDSQYEAGDESSRYKLKLFSALAYEPAAGKIFEINTLEC